MTKLPEGTVTFLFSDVEGSTQLLERHGAAMGPALARHHELFEQAVNDQDGVIFETVGDAVYAAFARPADAVTAALAVQRALATADWGPIGRVAVRIGLHTGAVERRGDHYFGPPLFRAARLMAIGHGEQVLLSAITAALVRDALPGGAGLRDLGLHRLKDLGEPEHVHQLTHSELRAEFPALASLDAHPHNLPVQLSSFVGREPDLATVDEWLRQHRQVTLLGPGGIGKTRLAVQVAAEQVERFPDGVWFVDLASVRDPELVPGIIAATLGLREQAGQPITATLVAHLADRELLLVLDNLEQLLPACAASVAQLLSGAPWLRVLATSRAPLRISGEHEYAVPALAVGSNDKMEATPAPAVALFVERARAIRPDFKITTETGPAIARVCERLDGLPLAIELAVALLRLFTLVQLEHRLERRLPLLADGIRDRPERQQTLRATIAWSTELLGPDERRLFDRLGIFRGGFDLDAAIAVAGPDLELDALEGIAALVDQSLLRQVDAVGDVPRYTMLETIREAAAEALGDNDLLTQRFVAYWAHRADDLQDQIEAAARSGQPEPPRPHLDMANIRAAVDEAVKLEKQGPAIGIARLYAWISMTGGPWTDAVAAARAALDMKDPPRSAATGDLLHRLGWLEAQLGRGDAAREAYRGALEIRRDLGDAVRIVSTLNNLGSILPPEDALACFDEALDRLHAMPIGPEESSGRRPGVWTSTTFRVLAMGLLWNASLARLAMDDIDGAKRAQEDVLPLAAAAGDYWLAFMAAWSLAGVALSEGMASRSSELYDTSLAEAERIGEPRYRALALAGRSRVALNRNDVLSAQLLLEEAVALLPDTIDWPDRGFTLGFVLGAVAELSARCDDPDGAAEAWGAQASAFRAEPRADPPFENRRREGLVALVHDGMGASRFETATRRGQRTAVGEELTLVNRLLARSASRVGPSR